MNENSYITKIDRSKNDEKPWCVSTMLVNKW